MKQRDHRKITSEVVRRVAPATDLSRLIKASGEFPDLDSRGKCSHHSRQNSERVFARIRKARHELLSNGYSLEFQRSLGYALHFIQDLSAICTAASSLRGDYASLHNEIESKLSRYSGAVAYEGIAYERLEGEKDVVSFLKRRISNLCQDPQHGLEQPVETLETCFETCLSVADAVCNNERGFEKGSAALEISGTIEIELRRMRDRLDAMPRFIEGVVRRSEAYLQNVEYLSARTKPKRRSLIGQLIAVLSGDRDGYREQLQRQKGLYEVWFSTERDRLREVRDWQNTVREAILALSGILDDGYEGAYQVRYANRSWYALGEVKYRGTDSLKALVVEAKSKLEQAEKETRKLEVELETQRNRVCLQATSATGSTALTEESKLLRQARAALDREDRTAAKKLLVQVTRRNPRHEQAWLALSALVDDRETERAYLLRVLEINPANESAQWHLARLDQDDESLAPGRPQP